MRAVRLLATVLLLLSSAFAVDPLAPTPKRLWTIDLAQFGHQGSKAPAAYTFADPGGVVFAGERELAAYFVTTRVEQLAKRGVLESSRARLNAVVLDAATAQFETQHEWGTERFRSSISANADGNLLVRTGDVLQVYSPKFHPLARLTLHNSDDHMCNTVVSPSRRVLWIDHQSSNGSDIERIDANTLRMLDQWRDTALGYFYSVSDESILRPNRNKAKELMERSSTRMWTRVPTDVEPACLGVARFVSDDRILSSNCNAVVIRNQTGQTLLRDERGLRSYRVHPKVVSANGAGIVAVTLISRADEARRAERVNAEVRVYDVNANRVLASLQLRPDRDVTYDFALSPDGSYLAVMIDRKVELYQLPGSVLSAEVAGPAGISAAAEGNKEK